MIAQCVKNLSKSMLLKDFSGAKKAPFLLRRWEFFEEVTRADVIPELEFVIAAILAAMADPHRGKGVLVDGFYIL